MKTGRKNSTEKKGGRRSGGKGKAAQKAVAENNCQSIFSFTQSELENVLQMFEPQPGGGPADVDRGYGYLQDHCRQGYMMAPHPTHQPHHSQPYPTMGGHPATAAPPPPHHGSFGGHPQGNHMHHSPQQHMWYGNHMQGTHEMNANGSAGLPTPTISNQDMTKYPEKPPAADSAAYFPPSTFNHTTKVKEEVPPPTIVPQSVPHRFLPKKTGSSNSLKGTSSLSHSVAEKQRRDRINTLIDELRELVPIDLESAEASNQPYGEDPSKRPKHVVLSDTIKFVRNVLNQQQLQIQMQQQQQQHQHQQQQQQQQNDLSQVKQELSNGSASPDVAKSEGEKLQPQSSDPTKIALARPFRSQSESSNNSFDSSDEGIEINVTPMENMDKYSVNVNGKDRNGLLLDITRALKSMELEIKTAVIKTEATGLVNDSFEVDKSYCTLTAKEVETQLVSSLSSEFEMKRKRTLDSNDSVRQRADTFG